MTLQILYGAGAAAWLFGLWTYIAATEPDGLADRGALKFFGSMGAVLWPLAAMLGLGFLLGTNIKKRRGHLLEQERERKRWLEAEVDDIARRRLL